MADLATLRELFGLRDSTYYRFELDRDGWAVRDYAGNRQKLANVEMFLWDHEPMDRVGFWDAVRACEHMHNGCFTARANLKPWRSR